MFLISPSNGNLAIAVNSTHIVLFYLAFVKNFSACFRICDLKQRNRSFSGIIRDILNLLSLVEADNVFWFVLI